MTTTALELFGSAVAIFLAGVLYEGLKYYREALHARATTLRGDSQVNITKNECGANGACGGPAVVKLVSLSPINRYLRGCLTYLQYFIRTITYFPPSS